MLLSPESRFYAEFVDRLYHAAKVLTEHLTKHFVGRRDYCFASRMFGKLAMEINKYR
jgi:hypothetical protein